MAVRIDPIFGLETPILFAHRGGAGEVPESTEEAFRHAARCGTDVLELDVQLTRDGEIVVWHGPQLNIVHNGTRKYSKGDKIWQFRWSELENTAWVVHPQFPDQLQQTPQRLLLTLKSFLGLVPKLEEELAQADRPRILHLNIELKKPGGSAPGWDDADAGGVPIWDKLFGLLAPLVTPRRIVIASASHAVLESFRAENKRRGGFTYPTNLSWKEQLAYREYMPTSVVTILAGILPVVVNVPPPKESLAGLAFETSYGLASKQLVDEVARRNGCTHVFLTGFSFLLPAIDDLAESGLKAKLDVILATGVDGIMTDFPEKAARILGKI